MLAYLQSSRRTVAYVPGLGGAWAGRLIFKAGGVWLEGASSILEMCIRGRLRMHLQWRFAARQQGISYVTHRWEDKDADA